MTPDVDVVALSLLVDVAHQGSIGRAAALQGVSQPSASVRLRRLERRLGVVLFERSHTGTRLTDAGKLVSGWATDVLSALDRLRTGAEALGAVRSGVVRVAASYTIAEMLMPSWVTRLRASHHSVSAAVEVTNSSGVEALIRAREVNLGFVEGPEIGPGLDHRVVADDELVVIVPRGHRWSQRRSPIRPVDLTREPMVLREQGSGTRDALMRALSQVGAGEPVIALELGSTASVLRAVADGAGPTVASRLAVAADVARGALVIVAVTDLRLHRMLRAVWQHGAPLSDVEKQLVEIAANPA